MATDGWAHAAATPEVRAALAAATRLDRCVHVPEVGSTQDVAAQLAREAGDGAAGLLVLTDRQRTGRGRSGHAWDDDDRPGASLAVTVVLAPPPAAALVPHALGLGVLAAVDAVVGPTVTVGLKWPNDVQAVVDGVPRKLAGLLVERLEVPAGVRLLAGVGLNVDHRHRPPHPERSDLARLGGADVAPARLLAALVRGIDAALATLWADPAELVAGYRARCLTLGRDVRITRPGRPDLVGRAAAIDAGGLLVVADGHAHHAILSGTVRDAEGAAARVPPPSTDGPTDGEERRG